MRKTGITFFIVFSALFCNAQIVHKATPKAEMNLLDTISYTDPDYLLGKINYADYPGSFTLIKPPYASSSMYLRIDAYQAFQSMADSAKKDGIQLRIISAARNFDRQRSIWEAKWNGERLVEGKNLAKDVSEPAERARYILLYSSMPGSSRHHWGTDIDINSLEDAYFLSGKGKLEYEWLQKNASFFGFCQPYTPKGNDRLTGYEEEKWHWTFMPVSSILTAEYALRITLTDIKGFKGDETAKDLDIIKNYVLGIAPQCKP